MNFGNGSELMPGVSVRNTFLEFSEDDAWTVRANNSLQRQQTDSVLFCNSVLRKDFSRCSIDELDVEDAKDDRRSDFSEPTTFVKSEDDTSSSYTKSFRSDDSEDAEEDPMPKRFEQEPTVDRSRYEKGFLEEKTRTEPQGMPCEDVVSGCTTLMIKEVPLSYTQRNLMREINLSGFRGKYDFLYLPTDMRKHTNRGFAFINMVSEESAKEFYRKFHNKSLRLFGAEKPILILPADLQGFEENALQYALVGAPQGRRGQTKPIFLRPLPPYIAAKLDKSTHANPLPPLRPEVPPAAAHRPQERPVRAPEQDTRELALAMLQEALSPNVGASLLPVTLALALAQAQTQPQRERIPEPVAVQERNFCVYCGRKRLSDHCFCAYCGKQF
jgi:hypothetical protein